MNFIEDSSHLGSLKDVLYDHNQKSMSFVYLRRAHLRTYTLDIVLKFIYDVESNYRHRYAYMEGDPQRVLQPIEDDQHVSLVTLEQAIEPLDALVTGVRQMVDAVKERCEKLTGSLSLDEAASIMLFSMEAEPIEYCFYRMLNKALQNDDPLKLQPWRDYLRLLIHSLSKLPSVGSQTLYLGIADHINNQYSTGMLFTWKQFSFCATSRKNLEGVFGATGPRTIFRINSCTGKNIRAYSCFPTNDEVLLPAASQFKVIRTEQESTDLCLVLLEEVHCIPSASNSARDQSWQMIVDKSLPSRIDLSGQRLTDELMNTVAEEALIKKRCIEIDLGGNQITSQGVLIISKALNTGVSLQRLYLGGNRIADEGAFYLGPSMCNSSLKVLGLSDCGITDRGAQYLSDMLRAKQTLTVLGLEDNDIGNKGVALLVYGLESNKRLRRLLLARNKAISDSCVNDIINMLGHNQTLQRLDLRDCNLSQNAKERLRRAVRMKNNFDLWV